MLAEQGLKGLREIVGNRVGGKSPRSPSLSDAEKQDGYNRGQQLYTGYRDNLLLSYSFSAQFSKMSIDLCAGGFWLGDDLVAEGSWE